MGEGEENKSEKEIGMSSIEGKDLSLGEFLKVLFSKNQSKLFPNNCFPSEEMGNLFLTRIDEFDEVFIKNLLRKFLVQNSTYGSDDFYSEILLNKIKAKEIDLSEVLQSERNRRLLYLNVDKKFLVWEGVTWILDLLPHQPKLALQALDAYFAANFWSLPDYAISGLLDSMAIIRAKYINYKHKKEIFKEITPLDFEVLVYKLYEDLNYKVELTKKSHDGGIDIIAEKVNAAEKELVLIQCKRREIKKITVREVSDLLGTVFHKKATKGTLVSSTGFTSVALKFANENPSIELIDAEELILLLNENFGIHWVHRINELIKTKN